MINENLEQSAPAPKKNIPLIIPLKDGGTLEIKYDPDTKKAIETIVRNARGKILEYNDLKKLETLEKKAAYLEEMGIKNPENYVNFIK